MQSLIELSGRVGGTHTTTAACPRALSLANSMQRTTSIEIKLEGTVPFELSSLTENNEDKIFQLAQNGYTCAVHLPPLQMEYQVRVPAFGKSHILVRTQDSVESMVVYGVECMEGVQMSCDQIANRVQEIFGIDVSENLTACFTWENANDTSNGETSKYIHTLKRLLSGRQRYGHACI